MTKNQSIQAGERTQNSYEIFGLTKDVVKYTKTSVAIFGSVVGDCIVIHGDTARAYDAADLKGTWDEVWASGKHIAEENE